VEELGGMTGGHDVVLKSSGGRGEARKRRKCAGAPNHFISSALGDWNEEGKGWSSPEGHGINRWDKNEQPTGASYRDMASKVTEPISLI